MIPVVRTFDKRIVLGVTGSIAAYKAPFLLRYLQRVGATVDVILTEAASRFVGAATFSGLGARTHGDLWASATELHIELGQAADAILIAPATADTIARLARGRADDLLCATVLATQAPIFIAPALHPTMWAHAATQENVAVLKSRGVHFIGPANGEVASGDSGEGRLEEPEQVVAYLRSWWGKRGPLAGKRLVVTAGPTTEKIDPVRALTNESSGKMGFAIAEQAVLLGANVTLIAGRVALPTPVGATRIDVGSALDMQDALNRVLGKDLMGADALVMAAAVADYRPREVSQLKLKRRTDKLTLELVANPDILAQLGQRRRGSLPLLVGFALETTADDALIASARRKLIDKRADLVVANNAQDSLGREDNQVMLVSARDCKKLERLPKQRVASHILEWIVEKLSQGLSDDLSAEEFST